MNMQATPATDAGDEDEEQPTCRLGRDLGNCTLRRKAGCETLYDAMMHVLPPYNVRLHVGSTLAEDDAAQAWLRRLEDVTN